MAQPEVGGDRLWRQIGSGRGESERQSTIGALRAQVLRYETTIDKIAQGVCFFDGEQRLMLCNRRYAEIYGLAPEDVSVGKTLREIAERRFALGACPAMTPQEYLSWCDRVNLGRVADSWTAELKDGRTILIHHQPLPEGGWVATHEDVTERKLANVQHEEQAEILEMIAVSAPLENVLDRLVRLIESQMIRMHGFVLLLDSDGVRLRHGAAPNLPKAYAEAIDGLRIGSNAGSCGAAALRRETIVVADILTDPLWADCRDLAAPHGLRSCWSTPILSHHGAVLGTFAMYSKEVREPTAAEMRLVDAATRIAGIAIERKQAEDRIHFMANHDALTGLPNRTLLKDRLTQAVLYAQRYDRWATVVFVDLDNFKFINDSLGHNVGDELLKIVAHRMVSCIRATDTVVRLGGDEFVILLFDQPKSADIISATLQKVRAAIAEPIHVDGHDLEVTCSIGLANYPNDGTDADTLLANADAAMYRAKEIGRDNFQFYTPELNTKVHEKFLLQKELRNAIVRSEFVIHYQPQVDLRTGRVFAVEALIRWQHPTMGMISPIKFIPMAEETGLIVPIGDWILLAACRQNKAWQDAGLPPMTICVNVSARQFKEKNWVSRVAGALQESGLDARYLELELTESLIMQDVDQAVATMRELQILGVQLSVDDFGTGYSSLAALKNFPVARLKIDKSFISDILNNESDRAVASAVISLGQKLNLRVIAEGVETDGQVAFLRENNCDEMQGYHFSKPIPACDIEKLLAARQHS
ncbi:EAL domain-containing protein [Methylocapsa sp. S129]|uniref:EAL domain-containing protein n=1 Tax=Methylocapsa sp. S129 TaxID=1641869 RepID=UPI001AEE9A11|nr:EAL domain-containing protein [Methylocapsa sp. S129]